MGGKARLRRLRLPLVWALGQGLVGGGFGVAKDDRRGWVSRVLAGWIGEILAYDFFEYGHLGMGLGM